MIRHSGHVITALLTILGIVYGAVQLQAENNSKISDTEEIRLPGSTLTIHFAPGSFDMPRRQILNWISRSAEAVTTYYGKFPLEKTDILIVSREGRGIKSGRAFGYGSPYIRVELGKASTWQDLNRDWVMVHEMVHLAFPEMHKRFDWLAEGLAVYVESVARLQAGHLDERTVWGSLVEGMRKGLPLPGDQGLDFTPTWGRTYWGGATFCLVADLEIRRRTNGRKSLQDALRGVLKAGGDFSVRWTIRKALKAADNATGTTAMTDIYDAWRATPVDPKLPELWKKLGVHMNGKAVTFDDKAELAHVRRQIGRISQ